MCRRDWRRRVREEAANARWGRTAAADAASSATLSSMRARIEPLSSSASVAAHSVARAVRR
jgi:hypothetical protein